MLRRNKMTAIAFGRQVLHAAYRPRIGRNGIARRSTRAFDSAPRARIRSRQRSPRFVPRPPRERIRTGRRLPCSNDQLRRYERTPVIELNWAVAISFAVGPHEGLRLLDNIAASDGLDRYAPLHLAHADMFRRLGRSADAREWYRRALPFAQNEQVRKFIEQRIR
jgi:hypothetical protein